MKKRNFFTSGCKKTLLVTSSPRRQLTRDLFNERRRVSGAAVPTLVLPGSEETEGDLLDAAFGQVDIFSAAGIVGMMARGTWQKERDRLRLFT